MKSFLCSADENVKKLFTLGFQAAWRSNQNFKATTEDLVRRHNLDAGSLEVLSKIYFNTQIAFEKFLYEYIHLKIV